jgi:hypothetical protein
VNTEDKEFWEWAAPKLRRAYKHKDMTPEEIDAFLDSIGDEALSQQHIEYILESIRADAVPHWEPEPDFLGIDELHDTAVDEEVYQLNRNKGEEDEETLRRIEELRRRALDDEQNPDTLADGTTQAGEGS